MAYIPSPSPSIPQPCLPNPGEQELKVEEAFSKVDMWEHLPVENEQQTMSSGGGHDDPFAVNPAAGAGVDLDFALPSGKAVQVEQERIRLTPR